MDYKELSFRAGLAIDKLDEFIRKVGATASLESIRQQMIFIRDKADQGKNPLDELESSRYFTYRILASREFASPEELEIKKYIDHVSNILDPD